MKPSFLAFALLASCHVDTGEPMSECGGTNKTCVAFADAFTGYHNWASAKAVGAGFDAGIHVSADRIEYINRMPAAGSKEFPVGTVIVKEVLNDSDVRARQVFAMVKRGGDYNSTGARNWEWFELLTFPNDTVRIKWRGEGPPTGEEYAGDAEGGCNGCHKAGIANDFVLSRHLLLSK